jgi:ankyrin repeat protein
MVGRVKKIGGDLLLHAINHANVHEAVALIEEGEADVNYQNINGQTPLHVSALHFIRDSTL